VDKKRWLFSTNITLTTAGCCCYVSGARLLAQTRRSPTRVASSPGDRPTRHIRVLCGVTRTRLLFLFPRIHRAAVVVFSTRRAPRVKLLERYFPPPRARVRLSGLDFQFSRVCVPVVMLMLPSRGLECFLPGSPGVLAGVNRSALALITMTTASFVCVCVRARGAGR